MEDPPKPEAVDLSPKWRHNRAQRDLAVRQAHAYKTILDHHGIKLDQVRPQALAALPVKQGVADGVFSYTPPTTKQPPPPPADAGSGSKSELTIDEVKKMSSEDINKNWDAVSSLLATPPA